MSRAVLEKKVTEGGGEAHSSKTVIKISIWRSR